MLPGRPGIQNSDENPFKGCNSIQYNREQARKIILFLFVFELNKIILLVREAVKLLQTLLWTHASIGLKGETGQWLTGVGNIYLTTWVALSM